MQSKNLRQAIAINLDTMGMQGPVKRRDIAERVMLSCPPHLWCEADRRSSSMAFLQNQVAAQMDEAHSLEFIEQHMGNVPKELRDALERMPRFICISPRGGRDAEHVMSVIATADQWQASADLKQWIADKTQHHAEADEDMAKFLRSSGANCLADFSNREAAE